ncbi:unnamed protein product [Caenorhabditis brenneri]
MFKGQDILNTDPKFLIDKGSVIRKLQDELRRKTIKFNDAYKSCKSLRLKRSKAWNKLQEPKFTRNKIHFSIYSYFFPDGTFKMSIRLGKYIKDGISCVHPAIYHFIQPNIQVRYYFNVLKQDGSSGLKTEVRSVYLNSSEICKGEAIDISKLLDVKNGYLDAGALTVMDFKWKLRKRTMIFVCSTFTTNISIGRIRITYCETAFKDDSKGHWVRVPKSFIPEDIVMCLQITHGVRPQLTAKDFESIAKIAFYFGFSNTVKYCKQQLIKINEQPNLIIKNFKMAVNFNMERYLIHLLIHIGSAKHLVDILSKLDLEEMSSESMKAFVAKFFFL